MTRFLSVGIALVFLVTPCQAQTAKAVDLVPDDSLGFLVIRDLRALSDKVEQVAKKLKVEERVSLLELIQKEMGIREGINDKGSAVFIVLKAKDGKSMPGFVAALPVADRQKIAQQLAVKDFKENVIAAGEVGLASGLLAGIGGKGPEGTPKKFPVLVALRGDFALITIPDGRASLEAVLSSKRSITAALAPVREWLDRQDIAGVCTDHGVSAGLAMFLNGPGGGVETSTPGQFKQLQATFADVEKNVKLIAFGGRIENEGHWSLATAVHFRPEGPYAQWMAKAEALEGKLLGRFPDQNQFAAALARISAQTTFEGAAKFLLGDLPADKVDALTRETAKLVQQMSEVGVCVYAGKKPAVNLSSKTAWLHAGDPVLIARVQDANAFLDGAVDLLKHSHRAAQAAAKIKVEINYQEKEIAGKPCRLITIQDGEPDKGPQVKGPQVKGPQDKGEQDKAGPQVYLLSALDNRTVLACVLTEAGLAEATVAKFSKQGERSLAANPQLQITRKLLPDKLQVEVFLDLQAFGMLGQDESAKKQVSQVAPLGFAMRALPAGLEAQFVVPFDALQAVVDATKAKKEKK